jgi:hypothetical protein
LAANATVGIGVEVTTTLAVLGALLPPGPEQITENVALAVNALVAFTPLAANAPFHAPAAVQAVALVELHVNVEVAPLAT